MTHYSLDLNDEKDFIAWNWLTSKGKVNLDKIKDFNSEFANGFLLGEALRNSGLLSETSDFKNESNRPDILRNFTMIQNCLSRHEVSFDSSFAKKIINKESGAVVSLVNEIVKKSESRISLNKLNKSTKKDTSKNIDKMGVDEMNEDLDSVEEMERSKKIDKTSTLKKMATTEKGASQQNVLQRKFSEIRELNEEEAKQMRNMDDHTRGQHLQLLRLEELEKSKRHKAFMQQWQEKGMEIHSKNRFQRNQNQQMYDKIKNQRNEVEAKKKDTKLTQSIKDQADGIDSFEQILQKYNEHQEKKKKLEEVDENLAKKDAKGKQQAKPDASQAQDEAFKVKNELPKYNYKPKLTKDAKDAEVKPILFQKTKKLNDFLKNQQEAIKAQELKEKEDAELDELMQVSKLSVIASFDTFKTMRTKTLVLVERQAMGTQMVEKYNETLKKNYPPEDKDYTAVSKDVETTIKDYKNKKLNKKKTKFLKNKELCRLTLNSIVNLSEVAFNFRNENESIIDRKVLKNWMDQFVAGDNFKHAEEGLKETIFDMDLDDQGSQGQQSEVKTTLQPTWLIQRKVQDYLCLTADYQDLKDRIAIQCETEMIKDTVCEVIANKNMHKQESKQLKKAKLDYQTKKVKFECDYKVFITGHPCTGKKTVADKVLEKLPGLKKVRFNNMISDLLKSYKIYLEQQQSEDQKNKKKDKLDEKIEEQLENMRNEESFRLCVEDIQNDYIRDIKLNDETLVYILIWKLKRVLSEQDLADGNQKGAKKGKKDVVDEATTHKGFVVVGFPQNLNQCYFYEKQFSGYTDPKIDNTQYIIDYENIQNCLDLSSLTFNPTKLDPKGIGLVLSLTADKEIVQERSVYKRKNPETNSEHNTKPDTMNEKFKKLEGWEETESQVLQHYYTYNANIDKLNSYLEQFILTNVKTEGEETVEEKANPMEVQSLVLIDASKDLDTVTASCLEFVEKQDELTKNIASNHPQTQDHTNKKLVVQEVTEEAGANEMTEEQKKQVQYALQLSGDEVLKTEQSSNDEEKSASKVDKYYTSSQSYINKVVSTQQSDLQSSMNSLQSYYYNSLDKLQSMQKSFIVDLNSKDDREKIVSEFIQKQHVFVDEFREIMAQPETKVEIKRLLDDLVEQLWHCIEHKKDVLKEKRQDIILKNDIVSSFAKFTEQFEKAVSVEYKKVEGLLSILLLNLFKKTNMDASTIDNQEISKFEMDSKTNTILAMKKTENEEFPSYDRFEYAFSFSISCLDYLVKDLVNNKQILSNAKDQSAEMQGLLLIVEEAKALLRQRLEIQQNWQKNFLDLMQDNFFGTQQRLDDFIIDIIFREQTSMAELKQDFEEAIDYSDKTAYNPLHLYVTYEVPDDEINFKQQRFSLSEQKEVLVENRIPLAGLKQLVGGICSVAVNNHIDSFEVVDTLAMCQKFDSVDLCKTLDWKGEELNSNVQQKDIKILGDWVRTVSPTGTLRADKLAMALIVSGLSEEIESKLTDLMELIKAECVLIPTHEFLGTTQQFEEALENGNEDGYIPLERAHQLKLLILENILKTNENVDITQLVCLFCNDFKGLMSKSLGEGKKLLVECIGENFVKPGMKDQWVTECQNEEALAAKLKDGEEDFLKTYGLDTAFGKNWDLNFYINNKVVEEDKK